MSGEEGKGKEVRGDKSSGKDRGIIRGFREIGESERGMRDERWRILISRKESVVR